MSQYKGQQLDKIKSGGKHKVNSIETKCQEDSSNSDEVGLVVKHVLSATVKSDSLGKWIIVSGATNHVCTNRDSFDDFKSLKTPLEVTFGDAWTCSKGYCSWYCDSKSEVCIGCGTRKCKLYDVLYVSACMEVLKRSCPFLLHIILGLLIPSEVQLKVTISPVSFVVAMPFLLSNAASTT